MAKQQVGCESCRKWQEHYSQEHMDVSRTRFFKLMTGDFTQRVSIPRKFQNSLKGMKISKGFNLKVAPSRETWSVGVTKHAGGELFFTSGWGDFARAHELEENDLLIFTRTGNYSFDVIIFDASGCEKVSSFFFTGKGGPFMHKHFDNVIGGHQQADHCVLSESDTGSTPSRFVESAYKASAPSKKVTGKLKSRQESESPYSNSYHIKREAVSEEEQSDDSHGDSNYYYYSRSANILTEDEREEIFGLASIQPDNPAFVTILQKSHVRRRNNMMIVHSSFAADHLKMRSQEILFLRPDRKERWCVKYYHGTSTRGFHCRQWVRFVSDNGLRKDDVCVFELLKKGGNARRKTTMVVHVVRKVNGRFVLVV